MNDRILFVDDEPNILQGIRRALRKDYDVVVAEGPEAGLQVLAEQGEFAVIVSDMRMPGMNGVEFLLASRQFAPDAVRMMLTGNHDQHTAIEAVNRGEVFRFLTKPCDIDALRDVIRQALAQYRLVTAEREVLERTLKGSVDVLAQLLSLARPDAFGRTERLLVRVRNLLAERDDVQPWLVDTATRLSQLGCLLLPDAVLTSVLSGEPLDARAAAAVEHSTETIAGLLAGIPRMESVAEIVRYQHKRYDGKGFPADDVRAERIPVISRALHLALACDQLRTAGFEEQELIAELTERDGAFDPRLLVRLRETKRTPARERLSVMASQLVVGMIVEADVENDCGSLVVCAGQRITETVREHLLRFEMEGVLTKPVPVSIDAADAEDVELAAAAG
jgi:response regulator RpfG family c-di-GMP phosphodiesterase